LSFQITVLKVLAGHTDGRASLGEVRHAVSLLVSSGLDWTNRMKRLASLVPDLDIFSRAFVVRDDNGWQITDDGLRFLVVLEAMAIAQRSYLPQMSSVVDASPRPAHIPQRLIGLKNRKARRNRGHRNRRSAA
jgi:hypothetical protein